MHTLTKKNKFVIAALTAIAVAFIVALPITTSAQTTTTPTATPTSTSGSTSNAKTLKAIGYGFENVSDVIQKMPTNMTLVVQRTKTGLAGKLFQVDSGTIYLNGITYSITSGNGGVSYFLRTFELKAQGTGPNGQTVTLKLVGQYFWMWGHLYVARIHGSIQIDNTKAALFLRGAIRV